MGAECCGGRHRQDSEIVRDESDSDDEILMKKKKKKKLRSSNTRGSDRNYSKTKRSSRDSRKDTRTSKASSYSTSTRNNSPKPQYSTVSTSSRNKSPKPIKSNASTKPRYPTASTTRRDSPKPNRSSKRISKKRTVSKNLALEKCRACDKNVDPLHGIGTKISIKQYGQFGKKFSREFIYCRECLPDCKKCGNDLQSTGGLVEDIQDMKSFYCSEQCYRYAHVNRQNTIKGLTTSSIAGSSMVEMQSTTFENDYDEVMKKIAPLLAATLRSPTCYFCRCEFKPKDRLSEGVRKAHFDCAAAGKAIYGKTRKKPKDPPMQPRVIAGYMLHQIELDMKKCREVMPSKDPLKYAQTNHSIKFEVSCGGKKSRFFLFVNMKDARSAVDCTNDFDAITFEFEGVDDKTQKLKKGLNFKSDIENDFVVINSDEGGLQFIQDTEECHAKKIDSADKKRITFETNMVRSNAGVSIRFTLRFSYSPKSGKLKVLPSEMLHTKI